MVVKLETLPGTDSPSVRALADIVVEKEDVREYFRKNFGTYNGPGRQQRTSPLLTYSAEKDGYELCVQVWNNSYLGRVCVDGEDAKRCLSFLKDFRRDTDAALIRCERF